MVRPLQGHRAAGRQVRIALGHCAPTPTNRHTRFSEQFNEARFYKLDVDEVPDVAQDLNVRAMPTFKIFKNKEQVGEVVGANPNALKAAIQAVYPAQAE